MVHVNGKWQQFLKSQDPTPNAEFKLVSYPNTVMASLATSTGPPNLASPRWKLLRNLQFSFKPLSKFIIITSSLKMGHLKGNLQQLLHLQVLIFPTLN